MIPSLVVGGRGRVDARGVLASLGGRAVARDVLASPGGRAVAREALACPEEVVFAWEGEVPSLGGVFA